MLFYVCSGYVFLPNTAGTFRNAGLYGLDWSSRSYSTADLAYYLRFGATGVLPSRGPYERWHSFPLRCLSTVLGM